MCERVLLCWTDPFCFCAPASAMSPVCCKSGLLARGRLHSLARSRAHSPLPSDHASLHLYFRFPGVLSLDIFLSPSREEQSLKCLGYWGRWTHSWKGGLESWHRQTESAVISPPPRSQRGSICIKPPLSSFLPKKTPQKSVLIIKNTSRAFFLNFPLHYKGKLSPSLILGSIF
uniref:Uncharacterized protein n=1 Tax=Molossus molossus TaxID=27622 RepID=A0A7J8JVK3_MOLMO|nr:hypothetical protein HJG59_007839 [Molossus molossus]